MARPAQYRPEFARQAGLLCRLGADNADLARTFAVSPATLYRWLHQHPAFAAAAKAGRALLDQPTPSSLFRRATGYEYRAERVYRFPGKEPVVATYRRRVLADPNAALLWLRNRRPESWRLPARADCEQSRPRTAWSGTSATRRGKSQAEPIDSHNALVMHAVRDFQANGENPEGLLILLMGYVQHRRDFNDARQADENSDPPCRVAKINLDLRATLPAT